MTRTSSARLTLAPALLLLAVVPAPSSLLLEEKDAEAAAGAEAEAEQGEEEEGGSSISLRSESHPSIPPPPRPDRTVSVTDREGNPRRMSALSLRKKRLYAPRGRRGFFSLLFSFSSLKPVIAAVVHLIDDACFVDFDFGVRRRQEVDFGVQEVVFGVIAAVGAEEGDALVDVLADDDAVVVDVSDVGGDGAGANGHNKDLLELDDSDEDILSEDRRCILRVFGLRQQRQVLHILFPLKAEGCAELSFRPLRSVRFAFLGRAFCS